MILILVIFRHTLGRAMNRDERKVGSRTLHVTCCSGSRAWSQQPLFTHSLLEQVDKSHFDHDYNLGFPLSWMPEDWRKTITVELCKEMFQLNYTQSSGWVNWLTLKTNKLFVIFHISLYYIYVKFVLNCFRDAESFCAKIIIFPFCQWIIFFLIVISILTQIIVINGFAKIYRLCSRQFYTVLHWTN